MFEMYFSERPIKGHLLLVAPCPSFFSSSLPPLFNLLGNYYGTPKPPAEPNLVQPDLVDQVLFDEDYSGGVPRKRTTSVSKMDRKDSAVPEEEDDDDRPPLVNGLPGQ